MTDLQFIRSALDVVDRIIDVICAGLVPAGYNQQVMAQATADEKNSQCYTAIDKSLLADASPKDISRVFDDRCGSPYRTNPYAVGGLKCSLAWSLRWSAVLLRTTGQIGKTEQIELPNKHSKEIARQLHLMTEKWKIELTEAAKEIARRLPELIKELERINDRQEALSEGEDQYKERSTQSVNQRDN